MRYVHLDCLQQWRLMSGRGQSFYECDQCHYQYRLSRMGVYHLVTHEVVISAVTFAVVLAAVVVCGYLGRWLFNAWVESFLVDDLQFEVARRQGVEGAAAALPHEDRHVYRIRYGGGTDGSGDWLLDPSSWTYHMLSGTVVFGFLSFLQMGVFFNHWRFGGGGGGRGGNDGFSILILVMVLIGMVRSAWLIHQWIQQRVRKYGVLAAESVVLDIGEAGNNDDDDRPADANVN